MTRTNPWLPDQAHLPPESQVAELADFIANRRVAVLTGAGCSTESGIPDYRGPITGARERTPLTWQNFIRSIDVQRRYWARAVIGWPAFRDAQPNDAHKALANLESAGFLNGIITQNVDRLHHRGGSQRIVELHGSLHLVRCVSCRRLAPRERLQQRLLKLNPDFDNHGSLAIAPDGDADIDESIVASFQLAGCRHCGGPLKPGVVMFGENVERPVRDAALALAEEADALLVVGSSLTVYSGFRFLQLMHHRQRPVAFVNLGPPTRGADLCTLSVNALAGPTLTALSRHLRLPPAPIASTHAPE